MRRAKQRPCLGKFTTAVALGFVAQFGSMAASAHELYKEGDTSLEFNLKAMYAWMSSQESYYGKQGRSTWQEASPSMVSKAPQGWPAAACTVVSPG